LLFIFKPPTFNTEYIHETIGTYQLTTPRY